MLTTFPIDGIVTKPQEQHPESSAVLSALTRAAFVREFADLPEDAIVAPSVAAAVLNKSGRWIEKKRHEGGGPEYVVFGGRFVKNRHGDVQRFGGRVAYRKSALIAYLASLPSFTVARVDREVA